MPGRKVARLQSRPANRPAFRRPRKAANNVPNVAQFRHQCSTQVIQMQPKRRVPNRAVRRHRPPAPFSLRVHVMLYTSYMLLDFCNAIYNEA